MKNRFFQFLIVVFFVFNTQIIKAQQPLPIYMPGELPRLSSANCPEMASILKEEIYKNKHWKKLVENKKMAIGLVDLHDINNIKFAGLNENNMMYAASMPKIAILVAVMHAIEKGEVEETEAVKNDLRLMISKSNNAAATRMIDLVGFKKIEAVLRLAEVDLYNEKTGGGLWVGKRYAKSGKRHPDPMKGLSHAATTYQACSFYYKLVFGKLISQKRSAEMLGYLKDPKLHHKFINTLQVIAPDATFYRKSGSWKSFHADSVLVWGPGRHYIIVAIIEDASGESIIRKLIVPLEEVLKKASNLDCNG